MLYASADTLILDDIFLRLPGFTRNAEVALKIEAFNFSGSIKLKTAVALVDHAERRGTLRPGGRVIESSSGNLGVALSLICAVRSYSLTCVTDPNACAAHIATMHRFGADVVVIRERDPNGGYLGQRLRYIEERLREDDELVWTNQYGNPANPNAHRDRTASAILREFPRLDALFVGAGTTGTLMGCIERFRAASPGTIIVAIDSVGSVTFGAAAAPRHLPGLGSSQQSQIFRPDADVHLHIEERDAIEVCHMLAREYGVLAGASTGSVLAGVREYVNHLPADAVVVAISPDLGDRYLETVYSENWLDAKYGTTVGTQA